MPFRKRHDLLVGRLLLTGHLALAVEGNAFLDDELRGPDVPLDDARREDVHLLAGVDVAHDLPARYDRTDADLALEVGLVARDERVLGQDLALHPAIHPDGPLETEHALELRALAEERGDLRMFR